ncbi:hypothetical protein GW17_00055790, partial [Ensete ventricosum]
QLECASDAHLEINLAQLAPGEQICLDGEASATYVRATQIPRLVGDMYTLPSKVLMARATKALVLLEFLREEIQRLKDGCNPDAIVLTEQRAAEAQALADNLKAELEELVEAQGRFDDSQGQLADTRELLTDSEGQLRNLRTQVRQIEDELLNLTWAMDALRVDLPKQAIKEYKKSPGFEMGLVRIGRVFLEYG